MRLPVYLICFGLMGLAACGAWAADISDQYEWDRVWIGGGGYQTGVVSHPTISGLLYLKGDVMGLHRRKPDERRWTQTAWDFNPDQGGISGCGGVAIDPRDGAVAYTTFGSREGKVMGLYKTTDYGTHWKQILHVWEATNLGDERKWANNVALDPNNPDILYFGSRNDGLFRSLDGGQTFDQKPHPDVPASPDKRKKGKHKKGDTKLDLITGAVGTRAIVIDPRETLDHPKRSRVIYLSIYTQGVWRSLDGGTTFAPMDGSPAHVRFLKRAANGTLYALGTFGEGLWKYDGQWSQLLQGNHRALAVDPHDPHGLKLFMAVGGSPDAYMRSVDGGETWQSLKKGDGWREQLPGDWNLRTAGAAVSSLDFDLSTPNRLFSCDAFGVWETNDPWATPIVWKPMHEGCEGTVSFALSCPPDNGNVAPLYSGGSDANNYVHLNPTGAYPTEKLAPVRPPKEGTQYLAYCSDYDFCMTRPNVIYRVVQAHNRRQYVVKTTNGGLKPKDWQVVASSHKDSPLARPLAWNGRMRKLAVSATDPDAVFMAGRGGYGNHYTTDGGKTWTRLTGVVPKDEGFIVQGGWSMYGTDKPICADRVDGNYIYAYRKKQFYRSNNKGVNGSWTRPFKFPAHRAPNTWKTCAINLSAAPGHAGHLALGLGKSGLWLTTDHGDTWRKVETIADCRNAGWGKKAPNSKYATLYIHARIGEQWGIYRSTDMARTWDRITPDHIAFSTVSNLVGDLQTFGTVYFSNSGNGVVYGKLRSN